MGNGNEIDFEEFAGCKVKLTTIDGVTHDVVIWGLDFESEDSEKVVGIATDKFNLRPQHVKDIELA